MHSVDDGCIGNEEMEETESIGLVRCVRLRNFQGISSGMQEILLGMADQESEVCVCNGEQKLKLTTDSSAL